MRNTDFIQFQCRLEPQKPALIAGDTVVTFGMLETAVAAIAARIAALGLRAGSIVGIAIDAPSRHVAVSLALARCGHASMPFRNPNSLAQLPDLDIALTDAPMAMSGGKLALVVGDDWFDATRPADSSGLPKSVPGDRAARILLSSGTTGVPKPIVHTFDSIGAAAMGVALTLDTAGGCSRALCLMPLSSGWGYMMTLGALARGITVCLAAGATEGIQMLSIYQCDYAVGSVHQVQGLVEQQRKHFTPLPGLRAVGTGGSMVPRELAQAARELLAPRMLLCYGSTELGLSTMEVVNSEIWIDGAAGTATPGTEIQVVDDVRQQLAHGEEGELRLRCVDQALLGGIPADDGGQAWFYPGDRGYLQADGRLVVTGRTVDLINIGGQKITAERIEQVLLSHPKVKDAAVMPVPGRDGLTMIRAGIVSIEAVDDDDLRAHVSARIRGAAPHEIRRVDAIPRTEIGKVHRARLGEILGD